MKAPYWYAQLAAVPHLDYVPLQAVDVSQLLGFGARPRIERYEFDGEISISLQWSYDGTQTSASPCHSHTATANDGETRMAFVLRELTEKLALPGTPSDYHFALLSVQTEVWKQRREQPEALTTLEALCWLDIRLQEARPDALWMNEERPYPHILAFEYLFSLLEGEGYLHEALDVARRAEPFHHLEGAVAKLTERLSDAAAEV